MFPTPLDAHCSEAMSPYGVVAFGGSAGAINAIAEIFGLLPATFRIPILVVQHLPSSGPISVLPAVLGRYSHLKVKWAEQGERPLGGTVYLAPRDHHMTVLHDGTLLLCCSSIRVNHCRPAVDPLFQKRSPRIRRASYCRHSQRIAERRGARSRGRPSIWRGHHGPKRRHVHALRYAPCSHRPRWMRDYL